MAHRVTVTILCCWKAVDLSSVRAKKLEAVELLVCFLLTFLRGKEAAATCWELEIRVETSSLCRGQKPTAL